MPYSVEDKLVVAIASSALFELSESDKVFREEGEDAYRAFQRAHENEVLSEGVAFPFIKRLLSLNDCLQGSPVEVILLSKNDADTGLRVFNSIEHFQLNISRAAFLNGGKPYRYISSFKACLFLSADPKDVKDAIMHNLPAGVVLDSSFADDQEDRELRVAFDFDGVLADDEAEKVFQETKNLAVYHSSEQEKALQPLKAGPLKEMLEKIAKLQKIEREKRDADPSYEPRITTAIITARNAPAHKRLIHTLREWGIIVDQSFFLGGLEKSAVVAQFRPHIFFDDQKLHVDTTSGIVPSVHVPFGITNE